MLLVGSDTQHIANSLCCLLLGGSGDMGVGVQGEAYGEVPQHSADDFDIHAVLKGYAINCKEIISFIFIRNM